MKNIMSLGRNHDLSVYVFDATYQKYMYYAYSKPYTRLPAYLAGVAGGAYLWKVGRGDWKRPSAIVTQIVMFFSVIAMTAMLLSPVADYREVDSWGFGWSFAYIGFFRPLWAMGCCIVGLACALGHGGPVQWLLGHPAWTPMARLTYSAYLLHPIIIKNLAGTTSGFYHFGWVDLTSRFVFNSLLTWSSSIVLCLLVERPILELTNRMLRR